MDNIIKLYLKSNNSKSDYTKKTFEQNIKRLEYIVKLNISDWDSETFNNSSIILDELINDYSLNSVIATVNTLLFYLKSVKANEKIINKYTDILNDLADERQKEMYKQEAGNKELSNWVDYNEMKSKLESLSSDYLTKKKSFTAYRNYLILCLYVLNIPARIQNYLIMKNKNSKSKDDNYIYKVDDKYKLVFNKYKTAKYLGTVNIIIENEILNKLIDKWFDNYNNSSNDLFLMNANKLPMKQNNFTQAIKSASMSIFNKDITVNDIRHIFLTNFLESNKTIEEKIKVANIMGQTYKPSRMELYQRQNLKNKS